MLNAIILFGLISLVFAQTPLLSDIEAQVGTPTITNSLPLQLTAVSTPTTFTTCYLRTSGLLEGFNPTASVPSGAVCYQIVQSSNAVIEAPKYTVGVSSSGSGSGAAIAGAIIGTIIGVTILVLCFIFWRKRVIQKKQMNTRASRPGVWSQRSGGWVEPGKPRENIDLQNWSAED